MVSAAVSDALFDPTRSLLALETISTYTDELTALVRDHFSATFHDSAAFQLVNTINTQSSNHSSADRIFFFALGEMEIPPLDVRHPAESFTDRSIVRFRCMIQDTSPSPELYRAKLTNGSTGGWGLNEDAVDEDVDFDRLQLKSRTVLWAVSIPGEAGWVSEVRPI
jgi:hypothetical protein